MLPRNKHAPALPPHEASARVGRLDGFRKRVPGRQSEVVVRTLAGVFQSHWSSFQSSATVRLPPRQVRDWREYATGGQHATGHFPPAPKRHRQHRVYEPGRRHRAHSRGNRRCRNDARWLRHPWEQRGGRYPGPNLHGHFDESAATLHNLPLLRHAAGLPRYRARRFRAVLSRGIVPCATAGWLATVDSSIVVLAPARAALA